MPWLVMKDSLRTAERMRVVLLKVATERNEEMEIHGETRVVLGPCLPESCMNFESLVNLNFNI